MTYSHQPWQPGTCLLGLNQPSPRTAEHAAITMIVVESFITRMTVMTPPPVDSLLAAAYFDDLVKVSYSEAELFWSWKTRLFTVLYVLAGEQHKCKFPASAVNEWAKKNN